MSVEQPMAQFSGGLPEPFLPMGMMSTFLARKDPERPMLTCDGVTISRRTFEENANRRARALAQAGVVADDLVTIALPNSIAFYELLFACWKLGATPNPVSAKLPPLELQAIIELARPRLIIGVQGEVFPGFRVLAADATLDHAMSAEALEPKVAKYWRALTSGGSTGRPKLIVDHMASVWDPAMTLLRQQVNDTILNAGPLYHAAPMGMTAMCLLAGGHVVEMGKFDALQALQLIERHRVGWVNFVPTMMNRIWRLPAEQRLSFDMSSLHTVFHMSAACPMWLKEEWINWLGPDRIWELYGGTERTGQTQINGREWLEHKGSVGKPVLGAQMRIINEEGVECAPGEVGEIYFIPEGGTDSTYHYVGAEAKSIDGWQSLGDLGYTDADGYLYLADRRTDLIIAGGANIYPAEVEAALAAHPEVAACVVIGLPHDDLGQAVHALVQPSAGADLSAEKLVSFLETRLVRYKIPRSFEFVAEPLHDEWGKVRRSALRDARAQGHP